ncbi:GTPase [uncultured Thiodictyon sp.]|uniref:GTPase family protein n=1 Tax=uncultured Thiodictyon sp. TaxID=1846217 RepID=UPI0025FEEFBF|nr:GTPase [uncultured Thiodictyon sp.]
MLTRADRLRLIALLLWAMPVAALLPLGLLWLWRSGNLPWWLAGMVACSAAGYGFQFWLRRRDGRLLAGAQTAPDPQWPPRSQSAWDAIESMAQGVRPEDWPLTDNPRLPDLGREALETVARIYHPAVERPLLELTLPHLLLIVERAARDLRTEVAGQLPLSHRLTLGDLMRAYRWKATAGRLLDLYRAGRLVFNPAGAVLSEAWERLRRQSFGAAWSDLHRWLLQEYIRKVGYYAIELYSGRLTLSDDADTTVTPASREDLEQAATVAAELAAEPLRILVLGRANAGKSSLINALFGQLTVPADVLPDLDGTVAPYRLEHAGLTAALVFDTPGCDTAALPPKALDRLATSADLVLWVTAANRADRQVERETLDRLRTLWAARADHHPPPLLIAVSHIDLLRPPRDWQPPYDLTNPQGPKATNIRAALQAVAEDLAVPLADAIPVCLAEGRVYNVADTLWAALLERQGAADRVRLLRCLDEHKRAEDWALLRQQLSSTGRFLARVSGRLLP